ncbi:helix-turn-helix domain-containing protein [Roseovarius sp. MMSF_3359]|uniref:helix-turn-helix domain-containing protein n=1 Tax=unclassified Roseovarius TaxID=2614913 RepID=UPI003531CC7E
MTKIDRLSALMSRFKLLVTPCDLTAANFLILGDIAGHIPAEIRFAPGGAVVQSGGPAETILLSARVEWGGSENPLLAALPPAIRHPVGQDPEMQALAQLLVTEKLVSRCGSASVLNRLGEVLIVRLMRAQIEAGAMQRGLLGGLADARLSRAIVAIHDRPGHPWRVDTLAEEAGLSISRFAELFREAVGETPLAYLRKWRLILARQDIERGERVQRVANRYAYGSTEALSRAISSAYGISPLKIRKAAQPSANA